MNCWAPNKHFTVSQHNTQNIDRYSDSPGEANGKSRIIVSILPVYPEIFLLPYKWVSELPPLEPTEVPETKKKSPQKIHRPSSNCLQGPLSCPISPDSSSTVSPPLRSFARGKFYLLLPLGLVLVPTLLIFKASPLVKSSKVLPPSVHLQHVFPFFPLITHFLLGWWLHFPPGCRASLPYAGKVFVVFGKFPHAVFCYSNWLSEKEWGLV